MATRPHVRLTGQDGQIEATARQLRSARLSLTLGELQVDFADPTVRRVSLIASGSQIRLNVGAIEARGVRLRNKGMDVTLHNLVVPKGLFASEEVVRAAGATASHLSGSWHGLSERAPEAESVETSSAPFDLGFLDALSGRVKVDVGVDIQLPLIHMRHANHRVRLDIRDGALSYSQLEHSLEELEDAVINFRHAEDWLVLEKDIPLIPFDRRTLVRWPLNADEDRKLAEDRRVRMSLLSRFDVPSNRRDEAHSTDGGGVMLKRLQFANVQCDLTSSRPLSWMAGSTELILGGKQKGVFKRLTVQGAVGLKVGAAHEGALIARAEDIRLRVPQLVLTSCDASIGSVRIAALDELRVQFQGLSPESLTGAASAIAIGPIAARWKNRLTARLHGSDSQMARGEAHSIPSTLDARPTAVA